MRKTRAGGNWLIGGIVAVSCDDYGDMMWLIGYKDVKIQM